MANDVSSFFLVDEKHYGGNQAWFIEEAKQNSGCGAVAGANIITYYAMRGKIKNPYPKFSINEGIPSVPKDKYIKLMELLYDVYIKQTTVEGLGVWFQKDFIKGMENYFSDHGITAKTYALNDILSNAQGRDAVDFIIGALSGGDPVALQFWGSSYKNGRQSYARHWMTITGARVLERGTDITISTWGQKQVLRDFEKIWDEAGLINSAFLTYFEIKPKG